MAKPLVSDELWQLVEPLLPKVERRYRFPGRMRIDDRKVLTGILYALVAESTAREIGLSLEEAPQLVLLYAAYEPAQVERAALRWFGRYLDEGKNVDAGNGV